MITVHYSCDSLGDHKALTAKLIDSEVKEFPEINSAIKFATECTECLNYKELLKEAGVSEEMLSTGLYEEDLLLDSVEFNRYRETFINS